MTQCVLQFFLSLFIICITSEIVNAYFFQCEIDNPGYNSIFSYNTLLKTHSNQEHDNAIHRPPFPESIEQLIEQIIHSIPV